MNRFLVVSPAGNSRLSPLPQNRYSSLILILCHMVVIEMSKKFGDISEKYRLSAGSDTIFLPIRKYRRNFGILTDF